jgi:hypothetical protein
MPALIIDDIVQVFDNGGETFDRYTVIMDDAVLSMSPNATSPQGVNSHICRLSELASKALSGMAQVPFSELPEPVKRAVLDRLFH